MTLKSQNRSRKWKQNFRIYVHSKIKSRSKRSADGRGRQNVVKVGVGWVTDVTCLVTGMNEESEAEAATDTIDGETKRDSRKGNKKLDSIDMTSNNTPKSFSHTPSSLSRLDVVNGQQIPELAGVVIGVD